MSPRATSPLGLVVAVCDLVVMRVRPEFRDTRGRFWRPGGAGYTDDLTEAGLWVAGQSPHADRAEPLPFLVARAQECPSWCVLDFEHKGEHRDHGHLADMLEVLQLDVTARADRRRP